MLGKGQSGGFPVEVSGELVQSPCSGSVDCSSKKGLHINCQLTGNVAAAPPQQSQVLLTPASLQLAQLQAQLTLQRLKLAQGGSPASAAVLNQVLSNVAMSQPLLSHLRASAMVANPQGTFTSGVLGFPPSSSSFSALASGVFNQSPNSLRPTQPMRGSTGSQQTADYDKKAAYPSDTDRRAPYNLIGGTSGAATADRPYSLINTQVKNMTPFQRDLYQDTQGQATGFSSHEQSAYNSTVKGEHWKSTVSATGNCEVSNNGSLWTSGGQVLRPRTDLYNPEEPTSDPKFNPSGMQRFGGYSALHGSEELKTLQPHQVNDYYAATPSQLPHQCSICDKKVYNLKDWEQHVKGKLHLQNKTQYTTDSSASTGAVHYAVGRPPDAPLSSGQTNSMVFTTIGQDVSSGGSTSFLPAAAMKTFPSSDPALTSLDPKSFPPRKATVGRVVHICNLPEGSCTENDVINLGLPFGKVTNYILMRSTHQAFLEMAYVEAAQAMVQYYQLTPAMINNQKLLIRMSKRYKELQLKKPGKDVETIIQDITSQRGRDETQEQDHYMPERARSRSPIGRSLSPGFNCEAPEGPQGALCRGAERATNGLVSHRSSWDWSSLPRRDEREGPWQNGEGMEEDRSNGWGPDRRKSYQKVSDHMSLRCGEERGGSRDWSSQRMTYRNMEDNYYSKEPIYKSDKPPRASYQRHDTKSKRRDVDHHRSRHSEPDTSAEDKRSSPERGRSKKSSRKHSSTERHSKERIAEKNEQHSKEKSSTPHCSSSPKDSNNCEKTETQKEVENAEDTDDESWYPKNMEELVTVDEVGGEDDIVEPDLPDLEECVGAPHKQSVETEEKDNDSAALEVSDMKETQTEEKSSVEAETEASITESVERNESTVCPKELKLNPPNMKELNNFQGDFKALMEETDENHCGFAVLQKSGENHAVLSEADKPQGTEALFNGTRFPQDIEALSSSCDQDKTVSEHSIPLGVEFIVPQSGFYCKLCGLFYSSEETAKATHCRSVVHYRNLQKYLSHLAEESLLGKFSSSSLQQ